MCNWDAAKRVFAVCATVRDLCTRLTLGKDQLLMLCCHSVKPLLALLTLISDSVSTDKGFKAFKKFFVG
jgi:hypothetical protein